MTLIAEVECIQVVEYPFFHYGNQLARVEMKFVTKIRFCKGNGKTSKWRRPCNVLGPSMIFTQDYLVKSLEAFNSPSSKLVSRGSMSPKRTYFKVLVDRKVWSQHRAKSGKFLDTINKAERVDSRWPRIYQKQMYSIDGAILIWEKKNQLFLPLQSEGPLSRS